MKHYWVILGLVVSLAVALLSSAQLGFFLALFSLLAWWTWENPEQSLLFLIIIAPLLLILKITQSIGSVTLLKDVIILTLFAKLFLIPLLTKTLPYRRNIFVWPMLTLTLWTAIGALRADHLTLGILRARDIVLYLLLYLAVLYMPKDKKFFTDMAKWFLASAVIVVALAVYQWFFAADSAVLRFDPARSIWIPRLASILGHPSILGQYLVIVTTLLLSILASIKNGWKNYWALGLLAGSLVTMYLTYSRAVWIGLAAAIVVVTLVVVWKKLTPVVEAEASLRGFAYRRILVVAAVGIAVLILVLKTTPAGTFIQTTFDPTYGSNAERIEFAVRLVAPMTDAEALLGRGLGDVIEQQFRDIEVSSVDITAGSSQIIREAKDDTLVDNQYLKTFVELGLAGILIYLWIFWVFAKSSWELITNNKSLVTNIIGLWSLGFLSAFVVQGFFIDIWEIFPTNAAFWIIAALISDSLVESKSAT